MPSKTQTIQPSKPPKTLRSNVKLSRPQLLIFALVFGVIGGFILYRTFAASLLVASIEAEQMSLPAGAAVINDANASSGKALYLPSNGTTSGSVSFPTPVTGFTLIARGAQCSGAPTFSAKLDSTPLLTNTAVGSNSWTAYTYSPTNPISSGTHSLSIDFNNDYSQTTNRKHRRTTTCSRDLYLDVSNFYGQAAPPPSVPTVTISASPNTLTAGQASTLTWNSTGATSCTASGSWSGSQSTSGSVSTGALNQSSTYNLACTGAGGTASGSAVVSVSAAVSTIKFGETNILPNDDSGNANLLMAQSATLSQAGTLQSLSFYVNNPAGKLRLGLYSSDAGANPGAKLAETAEITPVAGWNTAQVASPVSLSAGTYWLAYLPSDNALSFKKSADSSSSGRFYSYAYGALPTNYSATSNSTASHWSFYASLNTDGANTAPPPPSTGTNKLMWAPPNLTSPITINVSNTNHSFNLTNGQDYIIKMPATPLTALGGLSFVGGRNIVIIGGEIFNSNPTLNVADNYGIFLANQTGTVHIEGMYIHGTGIGQGIVVGDQNATDKPIIQLQRTRIESLHSVSSQIHTDGIQSYGGPYQLKMFETTIQTNGVGIQVQPHNLQTASPIGTWEWHRINVVQNTADAYALWKNFDAPQTWPITQSELYVKNLGYLAWANEDNYPVGWNRWNPGGDWPISGEAWQLGLRPAGDFVPAGSVGISYVSPGYQ